jgi:hypothetical protein
MTWNPYFRAYAMWHGRTCDMQIAADIERWPGGRMTGFILWMRDRWSEWRTERRIGVNKILSDAELSNFAGWLPGRAFANADTGEESRA